MTAQPELSTNTEESVRFIAPHTVHPLKGKVVPAGSVLISQGMEPGWPMPAVRCRVVVQQPSAEYAHHSFANTPEYRKIVESMPGSSDDAHDWGVYHRKFTTARDAFAAEILENVQHKPLVEILSRLVVLSQLQLDELQPAPELADDVFPLYR